jgi:hypothetical protein
MRFYFPIAVWGDKFVNHLIKVGVPTLLAPGNLPQIAREHEVRFVFFAPDAAEAVLRGDPTVGRIARLADVEFRRLEPGDFKDNHTALAQAHHLALNEAAVEKACAIMMNADSIISDGGLSALARLAAAGKKAVMAVGLRLNEITAAPALADALREGSDYRILQCRELMKFAMKNFHPEVERYVSTSTYFAPHPLLCLWSLGAKGMLARAFHLHPLLINTASVPTEAWEALSKDTIDGALILKALPYLDDIHVCQDSDEILAFSLSNPNEHIEPVSPNYMSLTLLQKTAYLENVNALHRIFFTKAIKLHTEDLDNDWERLERETAAIALAASDIKGVAGVELIKLGLSMLHREEKKGGRRTFRFVLAAAVRSIKYAERLVARRTNKRGYQ